MRGCFGIGEDCRPDEHQIQAVRIHHRVALEEREELFAALVLVDAPDVNRERPLDVELLPEPPRLRAIRNLRSDADDDARALPPTDALDSARSSNELYMSARTPRKTGAKIAEPDRRIALGRRDEDRLLRHRPGAVPRVVVAVAEEHEKIEIVRGRGAMC